MPLVSCAETYSSLVRQYWDALKPGKKEAFTVIFGIICTFLILYRSLDLPEGQAL